MARLSEVPGNRPGDAYRRCFGDPELAHLLGRVQSLIVRNGFELERLITQAAAELLIADLDDFLSDQIMPIGVSVATKRVIKAAQTIAGQGIEPDFLVFERTETEQRCHIVELKDGHEFDTKSSAKERENLQTFLDQNATTLHYYQNHCRICGFNATTRAEIQEGFKGVIDISQAMTGREFCELLGVDYDAILAQRAADREANFDHLITELLNISAVREAIADRLDS